MSSLLDYEMPHATFRMSWHCLLEGLCFDWACCVRLSATRFSFGSSTSHGCLSTVQRKVTQDIKEGIRWE